MYNIEIEKMSYWYSPLTQIKCFWRFWHWTYFESPMFSWPNYYLSVFFLNSKFMCFQSNFECFSYFRWVKQWHHLPITIEHSLILCSTFTSQQKTNDQSLQNIRAKKWFFFENFSSKFEIQFGSHVSMHCYSLKRCL